MHMPGMSRVLGKCHVMHIKFGYLGDKKLYILPRPEEDSDKTATPRQHQNI